MEAKNCIVNKDGTISFKKGICVVEDVDVAIAMSFNSANKQSCIYQMVELSLPKIKGLKSDKTRMRFTFDLVKAMESRGLKIST